MAFLLRRSKVKVKCEEARKIVLAHDISNRDLCVSSCQHLVKCLHCMSWLRNNQNVLADLTLIKELIEIDNRVHPEHKRNYKR